VAKELGLQIGKSDAPQLAVEKAAAGKGKGGKGKKAKEATPAGPPPQQAQHDPIKVPSNSRSVEVTQQPALDLDGLQLESCRMYVFKPKRVFRSA
jgi:hypothetical protein